MSMLKTFILVLPYCRFAPQFYVVLTACACSCFQNDFTPLYFAAQNGHLATVRLLLEAGASIDARQKVSGPVASADLHLLALARTRGPVHNVPFHGWKALLDARQSLVLFLTGLGEKLLGELSRQLSLSKFLQHCIPKSMSVDLELAARSTRQSLYRAERLVERVGYS
jgi:hypothetical protein